MTDIPQSVADSSTLPDDTVLRVTQKDPDTPTGLTLEGQDRIPVD